MPKTRFVCLHCGGSSDGRSDICTRPACLAWYWRDQAEQLEQQAREYRQKAERIEQAAPAPAAHPAQPKAGP